VQPGEEGVRLAEVGDAATLPVRGVGDRGRPWPVVPVEDLHAVTLAGQGEGSGGPRDPGTGDDDAHDSS
jgi:hypothetical protein